MRVRLCVWIEYKFEDIKGVIRSCKSIRDRQCFACGTSLYWLTPFELGYSAFLSRCMVIHVGWRIQKFSLISTQIHAIQH